ncbi:hypothetical protein [Flavobacterium cerinum]|uniref:Uncharacterized protein n=1 Tax=Flavobacterium cerinum TaxID=2502784 RepID=A0A3S3R1Z5_9FLAO|nr:hypothetical protein [Flavobacterium cerinum]RWX03387.1 hypothetical protein EPI11_00210 [Flavobacterium cerinum]
MKLDVFYDFISVRGYQIIIYHYSALDLLKALIEANGNTLLTNKILIYQCVTINSNPVTDEQLDKITASDLTDIMEAIGRQTTKMKIP